MVEINAFIGVIIYLYVNDSLIFVTNIDVVVHAAKRFISSNFDMKDMGEPNVVLCIKVHKDKYQSHYMLERCLKDLSTLIIYLCLHHMILKYTWLIKNQESR
jgi:hypothetical protein